MDRGHLRRDREKRAARALVKHAAMRHHAGMARRQLRTKDYPEADRKRLGQAVETARRAAGYRYRTDFVRANGIKNLRGLEMLEQGQPGVGQAFLFEVARALPGWDESTPQAVLEGQDPPPAEPVVEPAESKHSPAEPNPADYPDELEYLNAVYWFLRKSMSHEAVMRGFNMAAAIYARRNAERDSSSPHGDNLGRSS